MEGDHQPEPMEAHDAVIYRKIEDLSETARKVMEMFATSNRRVLQLEEEDNAVRDELYSHGLISIVNAPTGQFISETQLGRSVTDALEERND